LGNDVQQVFKLTTAFVVNTLAASNASEVESNGAPAILNKCLGQGLNHLVLHGAAKQRMGMTNDRSALDGHASWHIAEAF
jgi:hypothetical protein